MTSTDAPISKRSAFNRYYDGLLGRLDVPFETRFVTTRFGETHLINAGLENSDAIVLLHGAASNAAACWPLINDLAKIYRIHAIDIPRHLGKTEPFRISSRGDDYAFWLIDVLDWVAVEKAHFIGLSYGGWVSMKLAIAAPERLAKMVLISPVGIVPFRSGYWLRAPLLLLGALLYPSSMFMERFARFIAGPTAAQPIVDEIAAAGRVFMQRFHLPSVPLRPSRQELQECQSTTLVLLGRYDTFCDPDAVQARLSANLPHGEVDIIPHAGHALPYEHGEMINTRIRRFLDQGK